MEYEIQTTHNINTRYNYIGVIHTLNNIYIHFHNFKTKKLEKSYTKQVFNNGGQKRSMAVRGRRRANVLLLPFRSLSHFLLRAGVLCFVNTQLIVKGKANAG